MSYVERNFVTCLLLTRGDIVVSCLVAWGVAETCNRRTVGEPAHLVKPVSRRDFGQMTLLELG